MATSARRRPQRRDHTDELTGFAHATPSPYNPKHRALFSPAVSLVYPVEDLSSTLTPGTRGLSVVEPQSVDELVAEREEWLRWQFLDVWKAARATKVGDVDDDADLLLHPAVSMATGLRHAVADSIDHVTALLDSRSVHAADRSALGDLLKRLHFEEGTWRLVEHAFKQGADVRRDAHDLVGSLARRNHLGGDASCARRDQCRVILEWLEDSAHRALDAGGGPALAPYDDPAYQWTETANKLSPRALDMDAPLRGLQLDEIELHAEQRITFAMYAWVRAGQLGAAQAACRRTNQPWRAASLGGAVLDAASDGVRGSGRKHWRKVARAIARTNSRVTEWERAVYGILSSEIDPVLAIASGFEDRLWARLTAVIDAQIEKEDPQPQDISEAAILEVVQASCGSIRSDELYSASRKVTALLGLGKAMGPAISSEIWQGLLFISEIAAAGRVATEAWAIRYAAHVALFLHMAQLSTHSAGKDGIAGSANGILKTYCTLLAALACKEEEISLAAKIPPKRDLYVAIAEYAAHLDDQDLVAIYSEVMKNALYADLRSGSSTATRRTWCLEAAGKSFKKSRALLDSLVKSAVDEVWQDYLPNTNAAIESDAITFEDLAVINSIDLLVYPGYKNLEEALKRVNSAARRYTILGKIEACRMLMEAEACRVLLEEFSAKAAVLLEETVLDHEGQGFSEQPEQEVPWMDYLQGGTASPAEGELGCWIAYLTALSDYREWEHFYYSARPIPPSEETRRNAKAHPGEIEYNLQAAANIEVHSYAQNLQEYGSALLQRKQRAEFTVRDALLSGIGWMHPADDANRDEEVARVRSRAVPTMIFLLHNLLHKSADYRAAVGVADLVASATLKLYDDFGNSDLESFLHRIAESSVEEMQASLGWVTDD